MRIVIKMQSQCLFGLMNEDYHSLNRANKHFLRRGSVRMVMTFMTFRCCLLSTTLL